MKTNLPAIAALLALSGSIGQAMPTFAGYMQMAEHVRFVLTGDEDAPSSGWLAIGQSFEGYTLVAFDQSSEVLSVRQGDAVMRLPLKAARVRAERPEAPAIAGELAIAQGELAVMRQRYSYKHPKLQAQIKKVADLERQLAR